MPTRRRALVDQFTRPILAAISTAALKPLSRLSNHIVAQGPAKRQLFRALHKNEQEAVGETVRGVGSREARAQLLRCYVTNN